MVIQDIVYRDFVASIPYTGLLEPLNYLLSVKSPILTSTLSLSLYTPTWHVVEHVTSVFVHQQHKSVGKLLSCVVTTYHIQDMK